VARNGKHALECIKKDRPTIIISDVVMPEMDGWELCKYLKTKDDFKDIPFVVLTSLSDTSDVIQGLKCGADNFVTKPYDDNFLLSRIKHVLINLEMRSGAHSEMGIDIYFAGQKHRLNSERVQIIDLLLSTFENAVSKTLALESALTRAENAEEMLHGQVRELHDLSIHDPLTGLYNRRGYFSLAEHQLKLASRMKGKTYLFFIDVDGFKAINDNFGHEEGDRVLVETASFLKDNARGSDIVARLGGDEFVIMAVDASESSPQMILSRMEHQLAANNSKESCRHKISLSIGVATYDASQPSTVDELLSRADRAMYASKARKRKEK
jgi:two-component system cell cycle response regulator